MKRYKQQPEEELVENIIKKYNVEERRKRNIITIDPKNSKDFDDAMGLIIKEKYSILSIYIANVPLILDYLNLWADHKRTKFEKIAFEKKMGGFLPSKILIYSDKRIFKLEEF